MSYERSVMVALAALIVIGASGCTPGLAEATRKNDSTAVKSLLDGKAEPNVRDETESTPLHMAARNGSADITRMLIASKADVNATNKSGQTPLQCAAMGGHDEIVKALFAGGANPNPKPSNDGLTPLRCAIQKKATTAKLLLDQGAAPGANLKECVKDALRAKQHELVVLLLQQPGATLDVKALTELLGTAMSTYNAANIAILLDKGADPRQVTYGMIVQETKFATEETEGRRVMQMSSTSRHVTGPAVFAPVEHGDVATLEKLLAKGCDVNAKDTVGRTLVEFAEKQGNKQVVALIRERLAK
jgi:ankyrin repeat protein